MKIELQGVARRFQKQWIFKDLNYQLESGQRYAIQGPNGSGKSTLLRVLAGQLSPTEGQISWSSEGKLIETDEVFRHLSWAAPYIDLVEEFSLEESLQLHERFRSWLHDPQELVERSGLAKHRHKYLKDYSSGMRQRVKLILALATQSELLLLDEPSTNLDEAGFSWFEEELEALSANRLIIIASNLSRETKTCQHQILLG
jgi:ABC-type multidrug transport system ATPase subunit